jgi:hypothetical protein
MGSAATPTDKERRIVVERGTKARTAGDAIKAAMIAKLLRNIILKRGYLIYLFQILLFKLC